MNLWKTMMIGLGLSRFSSDAPEKSLIGVFSPGVSSFNLGDQIIAEAVRQELQELFPESFIIPFSSHAGIRKQALALYNRCSMRFWGGANMLDLFLLPAFNHSPDIPLYEAWQYRKAILMGTGTGNREKKTFNFMARYFYRTLLEQNALHSVRDEYTKRNLEKLGFHNVVNTGCPTTWRLTPEHCRRIPVERSDRVVFTLTDYAPEPEADRTLIAILQNEYRHLVFFPQGHRDRKYLHSLGVDLRNIRILPSSLAAYDQLLEKERVDYVGTRLHGGIRAMQKFRRALIIGIDIRAIEIHRDTGLPMCLRADQTKGVPSWIQHPEPTLLKINFDGIAQWKAQFQTANSR